jgi:ankyrin repeat protein
VTALMLAIDLGMVDVALLLIDAGADVNAKNRRGHTPLHMTVSNTHFEVAYKLIEYGCNIHETIRSPFITDPDPSRSTPGPRITPRQ